MGAGIAGCCLAIGLLQNPLLDVQVYEGYSTIRVRGSGLALHGNAIRAMDLISPEIKKTYFEKSHYMSNEEDIEMVTQFILASGEHAGTVVAELGRAKGRRTVHRAHFIQGLLDDAIPTDRAHFSKRVESIAECSGAGLVHVRFEDGSRETFDVVFGAEGVYSPTRRFIVGPGHPAANPVNHDQWRQFHVLVPMEEAKKVVPKESIETVRSFCTPVGFVNGIPVDLGRTYSIGCYQRDNKCRAEGAAFDAELWKGYMPEVDGLISFLEENHTEDWLLQDHDHAPTYYRGHVAMVGDAAHATYPHAGNGAAQAIEDCSILTGVFSRLTSAAEIGPALKAFDEVRRPRSQAVVDITRRFGRLYSQDPEEIDLDSMRSEMKEGGTYTNGVDMDAQGESNVTGLLLSKGGAQCDVWP
ncbi:hypothetical protein BKA67DRAFT_591473 [Truncatella angustata]|uniref:FAD-binding domain-containing protein n=1 Tax=Truncatella angustata TaxID=152316 RepID=A0A9P8UUQ8_9PEZI|nr:uncharacterized protein BKA67DRAFT_591473 [Truncatella angustata]KAH6658546.1 hypothetical protein BKA67DRAFT_591473 [Truncatella angustata]